LTLFYLATGTKLRRRDLVSLRVLDVVQGKAVQPRAMVIPHSLWHTYHATNESGTDPPTDQEPAGRNASSGHTKLESTFRDLGIEVDDAPEITEQTKVSHMAGKRQR